MIWEVVNFLDLFGISGPPLDVVKEIPLTRLRAMLLCWLSRLALLLLLEPASTVLLLVPVALTLVLEHAKSTRSRFMVPLCLLVLLC